MRPICEVFLRPCDRPGPQWIFTVSPILSAQENSLLRGPHHVSITASPTHTSHTLYSVMAVRSKKKGSGQSDDGDQPSPVVEASASAPVSPSSSNAPSEADHSVEAVAPSSADAPATPTSNKYVYYLFVHAHLLTVIALTSATPTPLGSPFDLTSSQSAVPSTPKKRKLSDAASGPSTPPSVRSSKSDSPYRTRVGGVASVVKAVGTLTPRVRLFCSDVLARSN